MKEKCVALITVVACSTEFHIHLLYTILYINIYLCLHSPIKYTG